MIKIVETVLYDTILLPSVSGKLISPKEKEKMRNLKQYRNFDDYTLNNQT